MPSAATRPAPVVLGNRLHLKLPDGSQLLLRAGPYGKGLTIVPVNRRHPGTRPRSPTGAPRGPGRIGRRPRAGTSALRARLAADRDGPGLEPPAVYVAWMRKQDPGAALTTAKTVVYRELRALAASAQGRLRERPVPAG